VVHPAVRETEGQLRGRNQVGGGGVEKFRCRAGEIISETIFPVPVLNCAMKNVSVILLLALVATGCTSKATARLQEQNAYLAGQNLVLQQQQAQAAAQMAGVRIVGAVQNPNVPWVTGLTLAQAVATANYIGADEPTQIIITRQGESATLDPKLLLNGADFPLEIGDVIELH